MSINQKNIKIGEKHHKMLKQYCDENGLKMYKVIEKWVDDLCRPKKSRDIYGD